jgi:hypothetical protein
MRAGELTALPMAWVPFPLADGAAAAALSSSYRTASKTPPMVTEVRPGRSSPFPSSFSFPLGLGLGFTFLIRFENQFFFLFFLFTFDFFPNLDLHCSKQPGSGTIVIL